MVNNKVFTVYKGIISLDLTCINDEHELFIPKNEVKSQLERSQHLPSLQLSRIDLQWVQVLSEGWATPLKVIICEFPMHKYS